MTTEPTTLATLVADAARRDPGRVAARWAEQQVTYGELADTTARLATLLISEGVGPGDRVGIYLTKSIESMVAVHGILRAGAVYVPLDPAAPATRIAALIDDCNIDIVVTHRPMKRRLAELVEVAEIGSSLRVLIGGPPTDGLTVHSWDDVAATEPTPLPLPALTDPAYIIYTSGSTGTPKGIVHTHASGLAYCERAVALYGVTSDDHLANFAPLHFDQSTFEFLAGPLAGATSILIPEPYLKLPASLSQLLQDEAATILYTVPFTYTQLLERGVLDERDLTAVRWVKFGGEVFPPAALAALMARLPTARFSNVYGPAEVNQCSYLHLDEPLSADQAPSIGVAWSDTELRIDDDGFLHVATPTMMQGYWNRPDLDAKAFTEHDGRRWYATGDLASRNADGSVQFHGRGDRQVKVRGYRVELEEVETAVADYPGVHAAVAYVDRDEVPQLVVAVVMTPDSSLDPKDVLRHVADRLSPQAVPSRIVELDHVPTTTSGKVDRRAVALQGASS